MSVKKLVINGEEHSIEAENGWVKTVNGIAWDVVLRAGTGLDLNWTTFSNSWVTSVNWNTWDVTWLVVSGDNGVTYTIKTSNSAPASGTPNTTITFRTN